MTFVAIGALRVKMFLNIFLNATCCSARLCSWIYKCLPLIYPQFTGLCSVLLVVGLDSRFLNILMSSYVV